MTIQHRYANADVPNVHTHVSAVHSVSDAVSLVIVSDGFANTNDVQRGEIHILHFSGWLLLHGSVSVLHIAHFECRDIPNLDRSHIKR